MGLAGAALAGSLGWSSTVWASSQAQELARAEQRLVAILALFINLFMLPWAQHEVRRQAFAIRTDLAALRTDGAPDTDFLWVGLKDPTAEEFELVRAELDRLAAMQERGIIRRIAIAPHHYALGMTANGMSVWDVDDDQISALGARIGALPYVTHCYQRPRARPAWPYNLFAMLHGSGRDEVEAKRREVAAILGDACRGSDILYSTRILKKTGLRLAD